MVCTHDQLVVRAVTHYCKGMVSLGIHQMSVLCTTGIDYLHRL